jgi:sarcosine oxidase
LAHDIYLLPPIRYPDGLWRIKIGGEDGQPAPDHLVRDDRVVPERRQPRGGQQTLLGRSCGVMPGLPMTHLAGRLRGQFHATGKPYVARLGAGTTVLTGGNGAGAKCADELGRLGAIVARGGDLAPEGYACDFALRLEEDEANTPSSLAGAGGVR